MGKGDIRRGPATGGDREGGKTGEKAVGGGRSRWNGIPAKVHLARYEPLEESLPASLDAIGWKKIVKPGSTVVIKVNGTHFDYLDGITVTPELVTAAVELLRDRASRVVVGESDLQRVPGEMALEGSGIKAAAEKAGGEVVNFSRLPHEEVDLRGKALDRISMPRIYRECDVFASMPVFKTHKLTTVTLTLKNHFGCITDDMRLRLHGKIDQVLPDMLAYLKPKLVIMDGRVAMEGDGPIAGLPKKLGLLLTATNGVAADAVACRVMGFDPRKIAHINNAAVRDLGPLGPKGLDLSGLKIRDVKTTFDMPNQDSISNLEKWVAPHPILSRLVYKTFFGFNKWLSWKIRSASGYKRRYIEDIEKRGIWGDNYKGLFK